MTDKKIYYATIESRSNDVLDYHSLKRLWGNTSGLKCCVECAFYPNGYCWLKIETSEKLHYERILKKFNVCIPRARTECGMSTLKIFDCGMRRIVDNLIVLDLKFDYIDFIYSCNAGYLFTWSGVE